MLLRMLFVTGCMTAVGLTLLSLRQAEYEAHWEMTAKMSQMQAAQRQIWHMKAQLAEEITPDTLRDGLAENDIALQPLVPNWFDPASGDAAIVRLPAD